MRFKLLIALLIILSGNSAFAAHGLSIYGDLKYPENFTHFEYVNPNAPKGGEFKTAAIGTFDTLNPFILRGIAAKNIELTYDTLMASSDDEAMAEYGLIAKAVELAPDKKSVTFTMNENARFRDGSEVTAEDVIFSFETLKTKGHPFYRAYYRDVTKVEKIGENKVKFSFASNENRELPLIIGQLPIISKAYFETHDFEKPSLEAAMASGPYMVESVQPGKRIVYKRDENYWAKDLPVNKGRHNFDKIIIDYYRDEVVAIEALKAGSYDFRLENVAKMWATAYKFDGLSEGKVKKEEIRHEVPTGMQGFIFNIRRDNFKDVRVREAIGYAFDFEWENKYLFFNAYTRTSSYFSNSDYASRGLPSEGELALLQPYKEQLPEEVFNQEFKVPVTDASGYPRENLLKAKQLLEDAGWYVKDGRLINLKTGKNLNIEILLLSPSFERVAAPFVRNLAKLGIDAKIRTVDGAQYQKRLENFDYDMTVHVFAQSQSPGNEQIDYWHSSKADLPGSKNYIGIKNPIVDALVEKIISAPSREKLIAATRALDRVMLWNYYVVPNWHVRNFRIIYWDKFARPEISPKYDLGLTTWWAKSAEEK